jgi:dienelactone hydrolase
MAYLETTVPSAKGPVQCRWYAPVATRAGVIWVGGVGGGWDTPAKGLYPRLAQQLQKEGIGSLRVRFRDPSDLEEAVHDVRAGIEFLQQHGIERLAFVGHSFGGAVVIQASTTTPLARAVITLATQGYGTDAVNMLNPHCAILLMHGTADTVLGPANSQYVYRLAHKPKHIKLYPGAGHSLDDVAEDIERLTYEFVITHLH